MINKSMSQNNQNDKSKPDIIKVTLSIHNHPPAYLCQANQYTFQLNSSNDIIPPEYHTLLSLTLHSYNVLNKFYNYPYWI